MLVPFQKDFINIPQKSSAINVLILGSTGSIGTSTLDIIESNPQKFSVYAIVAGKNITILKQQIIKFKPKIAACLLEKDVVDLVNFTKVHNLKTEVVFGEKEICSHFKYAPKTDDNFTNNWPKYMQGPY